MFRPRNTPTHTTLQVTGRHTFNIQFLTIQLLTYTQFILHMATYHMTIKVIYLFWQTILGIPSDCCPDDGLIGRNM